jgi:tripeptide aminopeptidase
VISPEENPELKNYVGQDIITSNGTTLLGADDKAGVAEIMTAVETMATDDSIKHGKIRVAFTPDEEVGKGADLFDVEKFGAKFAYTIDGGEVGEVENETFNAASAVFKLKGYNVHPGYAKDKMKNSLRAMGYLLTLIPQDMAPETTDGWEGYLHPYDLKGDVENTELKILLRDFETDGLEDKRKIAENIKAMVEEKFPDIDVNLEIKYFYKNMKVILM